MAERKLRREEAHKLEMLRMQGLVLQLGAEVIKQTDKTRAELEWEDIARVNMVNHMLHTVYHVLLGDVVMKIVSKEDAETALKSASLQEAIPDLDPAKKEEFSKWFADVLKYVTDNMGIEYADKVTAAGFVKYFNKGVEYHQAVYEAMLDEQ